MLRLVLIVALLAAPLVRAPDALAAPRRRARQRLRTRPRARSGVLACLAQLPRIALARLRGKRPCVVFDIDNTVVDARGRTREAARRFARQHGVESLAKLALSRIGWDGRSTAKANGASDHASTFQRFWERFFWNGKNFKYDRPVRKTILLAKLAKLFGAEVIYLTGRVEALRDASAAQLAQHGLPDARRANVICKPAIGVDTATFKANVMRELSRSRLVGWFASDFAGEVNAVQRAVPGTRCVVVDFPVKGGSAPSPAPGIPVVKVR